MTDRNEYKEYPVVWTLIPPKGSNDNAQVYYFPNYFGCFHIMRRRVNFAISNGWSTLCEAYNDSNDAHYTARQMYARSEAANYGTERAPFNTHARRAYSSISSEVNKKFNGNL